MVVVRVVFNLVFDFGGAAIWWCLIVGVYRGGEGGREGCEGGCVVFIVVAVKVVVAVAG